MLRTHVLTYFEIEANKCRTGEEIRSLSRFQVAQRTGFTKILKKYKRWTKDRGFNQVFKEQVSNHPDSLFQLDLTYLLDQYISVLGALRAVFDNDGTRPTEHEGADAKSAAARISKTIRRGDELDFDLALTTVPLGTHGNRATYWIHPDHFVEAQVLLLQQTRLYTSTTKSLMRKQSALGTPEQRESLAATTERYFGNEEEVGMLVLDHAEAFAMKQNASTISSTEATKGNIVFKAAGNIHCVASGEAAVVVCTDTKGQEQATSNIKTARLRVKSVQDLVSESVPSSAKANGNTSTKQQDGKLEEGNKGNVAVVQQWLRDHQEAKPIAGVGAKRTRLIGLHNNSSGGIWATLDKDVYMKGSMSKDLMSEDWPSAARSDAIQFPHAILEVRREGAQATSLIQTLDRSHLVCSVLRIAGVESSLTITGRARSRILNRSTRRVGMLQAQLHDLTFLGKTPRP
jgi:hypothetical protein